MTTTTGKAEDPAETARWEADKARVPSDPAAPERPAHRHIPTTADTLHYSCLTCDVKGERRRATPGGRLVLVWDDEAPDA